MSKSLIKIIRITAIVLMGLTVAITLLGGIGSTCAAFLTENFASLGPRYHINGCTRCW
jgi:hypothetical protein